jgi:cellulose synthase (UDP-forming)
MNLTRFTKQNNPPISTVVAFIIIILFILIFILWGIGFTPITVFFTQVNLWQQHPPNWIEDPDINSINLLLMPAGLLSLIVSLVIKTSPDQSPWSRVLVVFILNGLAIYYVLWRLFSSLNFDTPWNGFFSIVLLLAEIYFISRHNFQSLLLLKCRDRRTEVDKNTILVISEEFIPSVDILIPTYDEATQIIQRTVMGCQALKYTNKKIYVLDDTRRTEVELLTQNLGCEYITRPDNLYAKAGNLNHAISKTHGDLIVIFDVDFIPTTDFLTRTVGFFKNKKVGFLQTSQEFYNADLIASNLGLSEVLPHATENYYSHYQLLRDGVDCTGCSGSSMILNREAINKIGGFVTTSLSEDYFTGISISAQGYESVYVNEKLSAGLGVENMSASLSQRLRWSRGTLQGFFIKENPCKITGLKLIQRITHLEEGLLGWVGDLPRLFLLLIPFLYILGITPVQATLSELTYFLLPYYLVYLISYTWLNRRTQSFLIADIYTSLHCIPLSLNFFKVMISPFSEGFKVTPKGISRDKPFFNWNLAFPLIGLLALNLVSFGANIFSLLEDSSSSNFLIMMVIVWSSYNILLIVCLLSSLVDAPKTDRQWFPIEKAVTVEVLTQQSSVLLTSKIIEMSEFGLKIVFDRKSIDSNILSNNLSVSVKFLVDQMEYLGKIDSIESTKNSFILVIMFASLNLDQQRYLVQNLFCTPNQWQRRKTPSDLQILGMLLKNAALQIHRHFMTAIC